MTLAEPTPQHEQLELGGYVLIHECADHPGCGVWKSALTTTLSDDFILVAVNEPFSQPVGEWSNSTHQFYRHRSHDGTIDFVAVYPAGMNPCYGFFC